MGEKYPFLVRGAKLRCNMGSHARKMNLPVCHGVYSGKHPLVHDEDSVLMENITTFGVCSAPSNPAQASGAKVLLVGEDGKNVKGPPCTPTLMPKWMNAHPKVKIARNAGAGAANGNPEARSYTNSLTMDSFLVCVCGGIIAPVESGQEEFDTTSQEPMRAALAAYGFDDKTIDTLLAVKDALNQRYPQAESDWMFARIVGGLCYGNGKGFTEELKWNQTAGKLPFDNIEAFVTGELGIPQADFNYMQYKVQRQNQIVSAPENFNYASLSPQTRADYKQRMEAVLGRTMTDSEFQEAWTNQVDAFSGSGDYAHQMITTSSILATDLDKGGLLADVRTGGKREIMAGWLGDATLGDPPSFGNDDYLADLDASNITHLMREKGMSLSDATTSYYNDINNGVYTRAENFLTHTDLDTVKSHITDKLAEHSMTGAEADAYFESAKEQMGDTYNFIRSLEEGSNTMGDYH